jgi:GT2 family glycosyltransferase
MTPRADFPGDVEVVIVAHDNLGTLKDTLQSVADAGCAISRITLVDIASSDGTGDYLAAEWPGARLIRLARNEGPSPGRNVGIRGASSRFVLLMDADVRVASDAVQQMHAAMCADSTVKVGSTVVVHLDRPDTIQYAGCALHFICEAVNPWLDRTLAERGPEARKIGVAPACALLIDRDAAIDVGLFDERYFMGKDDGDFTHRVRIAGHSILELPSALALHRTRPRSTWLFYYQIRNRWHFILKNYEWRTIAALVPALLVHEPLQFLLLVLKGHLWTYLKAVGGLVVMLPDLPRDRAHVRRIRTRSDRDLLVSGPLIVRDDLAGDGLIRRAKTVYERTLTAYWNFLRRTVLWR